MVRFVVVMYKLKKTKRRTKCKLSLQVVAFFTSFCVNLYLVCCFLFNSDLRELKNYPIFLVNLIDLVVTGPGFFSLVFSEQFIQHHPSSNHSKQGYFVSWLNSVRYFVYPYGGNLFLKKVNLFWYDCLPEMLTQRLNEYSNCLCGLTLAYERYITICKPYDKDLILTDKRRYCTYVALTTVIVAMIIIGIFSIIQPLLGNSQT